MARIVSLGVAVWDRVFDIPAHPPRPIKVRAAGLRESGGGMAATAAVAAAALGGEAEYWGRVGDDMAGQAIRRQLTARGVETAGLKLFPGARSPQAAVLVDPQGERMLAVFLGEGLSDDPAWLPLERLAYAGAVNADVRWTEGVVALFGAARARGLPRLLDADTGNAATLAAAGPMATHTVFSQGGLTEFAGTEDPDSGLAVAASRLPGLVGVTLGAHGAMWRDGGRTHRLAGHRVRVRNSNGSGDVFHGAFALALAEGADAAEAMRFANAAAAAMCELGGGWSGMPDRALVERILKEAA